MSIVDRVIRVVIAVTIAVLSFFGYIGGGWAIGLGIVAFVLLLTGLAGYCPIYTLFGISTRQQTPIGG